MSKFTKMARELLAIDEDIPYRVNDPDNPRVLSQDAFELYIFPQIWGSTALGFGGMGGNKTTTATTYVLMPMVDGEDCIVYFAGRFAYKVPYSTVFRDDVAEQRMEPVYRSGKYVSAAKEEYR